MTSGQLFETRGSQEPVIAHLADSCQDKEHIKAIRSNIEQFQKKDFSMKFPQGPMLNKFG